MFTTAIFDLDGTLINSLTDLANACNYALNKFNYPPHELNKYKYFVGNGIYKLVERSVPEGLKDKNNVLKVKAIFDEYYAQHSMDNTRPYEGIIELIKTLKANNINRAVLTNKADPYAKEIVKNFFGDLIPTVVGQKPENKTKPAPDGVYDIIKILGINKEECIFIGDSNVDIQTANNAKIKSIGVLWGFRTKEELQAAGATYIVETPKEISNIILM